MASIVVGEAVYGRTIVVTHKRVLQLTRCWLRSKTEDDMTAEVIQETGVVDDEKEKGNEIDNDLGTDRQCIMRMGGRTQVT